MKCPACNHDTTEYLITLLVPDNNYEYRNSPYKFNFSCRNCTFQWLNRNQKFAFTDDDINLIREIVREEIAAANKKK